MASQKRWHLNWSMKICRRVRTSEQKQGVAWSHPEPGEFYYTVGNRLKRPFVV